MRVAFDVPAPAATQGSHRIGWTRGRGRRRAVVVPVSSAKLGIYRRHVAAAARAAVWRDPRFPMRGAVAVFVRWERPRPKSSRALWPATRPDLDKLARAVLDALSGILFADDGQVVTASLTKRWGDQDRTVVEAWELLG